MITYQSAHRMYAALAADDSARGLIAIRPVHLLRVSLLRVLESNFPGDPL